MIQAGDFVEVKKYGGDEWRRARFISVNDDHSSIIVRHDGGILEAVLNNRWRVIVPNHDYIGITADRLAGDSLRTIGERYNVASSSVHYIVKRLSAALGEDKLKRLAE